MDVGLKTFAILLAVEEIENPCFFRCEEKVLARVQCNHAKGTIAPYRSSPRGLVPKDASERCKHRTVVARVHLISRVKYQRDDFTHQQSLQIVDRYGVICIENLNVNRMVQNHCLSLSIASPSLVPRTTRPENASQETRARSISDVAWSAFFFQLSTKTEKAGRQFIKVNPAYTSQTCSACGHRQKSLFQNGFLSARVVDSRSTVI